MRAKAVTLLFFLCCCLIFGLSCGQTTYGLVVYIQGQGDVTPGNSTYSSGDTITLTASPASGWEFDHWGGHGSGSGNSISLNMDYDKVVYAYFKELSSSSTPEETPIATNTPSETSVDSTIPSPTYTSLPTATAFPTSAGHLYRDPRNCGDMKQFITPDDSEVQDTVDDILNGYWRWAYDDFEALREWVVNHVTYQYDIDAHGQSEYWQLPSETLNLGTGDCEDFAILLCTLLRAYGVPADEVYVGLGHYDEPGKTGHAFLFEHWYEGQWRAIEPQQSAWWQILLLPDLDISDYDEFYHFNDQGCFEGIPSPPSGVYEFEVGYSTWPLTIGAYTDFESFLNAGQSVSGTVEWHGSTAITYDWGIYVYEPDDDIAFSWSGKALSHDFGFTASESGTYTIRILKRDYYPRVANMEVTPSNWVEQ